MIDEMPKPTKEDYVHALTKAGISSIPGIGNPIAELFNMIIEAPLTRRKEKWLNSLATEIIRLSNEIEGFQIEKLSTNEQFLSVVLQSTQIALRTHQQEKIKILRNAILNSAIKTEIDDFHAIIFLNYIDVFTEWHIKVLILLNNPLDWYERNEKSFPQLMAGGLSTIIVQGFDSVPIGFKEMLPQIVKELYSRGLVNTEGVNTTMSRNGLEASRTTELGRTFLSFVANV